MDDVQLVLEEENVSLHTETPNASQDLEESSSEQDPSSKDDFSDPETELEAIKPTHDCNELDALMTEKKKKNCRFVQFAFKVDVCEISNVEKDVENSEPVSNLNFGETEAIKTKEPTIDPKEQMEERIQKAQKEEEDIMLAFAMATEQLDSQLAAKDQNEVSEEFKTINLSEVKRHFFTDLEIDVEAELKSICPYDPPPSGFGQIFQSICCCQSPIPDEVYNMRIKIFCVAKKDLVFDDVIHKRLLYMIYKHASGEKNAPPLIGAHWEQIGFQGTDPRTDLRACGVLSLINLLSLFEKHGTIARQIFLLSKHEHQHFPFCVTSITMSSIALKCLRSGKMDAYFENAEDCVDLFFKLHHSLFNAFYLRWKREHLSIRNFDEVKKSLMNESLQNPYKFVKKNESYLQAKAASNNNYILSSEGL